MKRIILIIVIAVVAVFTMKAQIIARDSTTIFPRENFELYQTGDSQVFLKLDSRNGKVVQIRYSSSRSRREAEVINGSSLASQGAERTGRFLLKPTENNSIFLLLDQDEGGLWQIQWNSSRKDREINRLN